MRKKFTPQERLVVAADFKPDGAGRQGTHAKLIELARKLKGTGVCIKVNADLRSWGYGLIDEIRSNGLACFADLKFCDIQATLERDGSYLARFKPEIVTVMCCPTSEDAMRALKAKLPESEVIGVTVLTDVPEAEVAQMFSCTVPETVGFRARRAGLLAARSGGAAGPLSLAHAQHSGHPAELVGRRGR
jgi:orotidine-5'-phosphate decarboxylase